MINGKEEKIKDGLKKIKTLNVEIRDMKSKIRSLEQLNHKHSNHIDRLDKTCKQKDEHCAEKDARIHVLQEEAK